MPQLGPLDATLLDVLSNLVVGATVNVYREGAQVNGNQSGTSPLTVNVRHPGKIVAGDTAFVDNDNSTTYTVGAATATTVQLVGFAGTLTLLNGQRIVPSNNQPVIYSDDQGGASVSQPLTSDAFGGIAPSGGSSPLWMEGGAFEILAAASGSVARLYQTMVVVPEAPGVVYSGELDGISAVAHVEDTRFPFVTAGAKLKAGRNFGVEKWAIDKDGKALFFGLGEVRLANQFAGADLGAQINAADASLGSAYGEIWATCDGKTITTPVVISTGHTLRLLGGNVNFNVTGGGKGVTIKNHAKVKGAGIRGTYISVLSATNVTAIFTNDDYTGGQQDAVLEGVFIDCQSNPAISQAPVYFKKIGEPGYVRDVYVLPGNGQVGMKFEDCAGMFRQDIIINGRNNTSPILGGILINDSVNAFGHLFINVHVDNVADNGYGIKITGSAGKQRNVSIINFRNEQNGGSLVDGIVLDSTCDGALIINPEQTYNSGSAGNLVHMLAGSSNNVVVNAYGFSGGSINAVKDDVLGRTITANCPLYIQGVTGANEAATINGVVDAKRLKSRLGTTLVAGDFAIVTTGKWGDTPAATVTLPLPAPTDTRGVVQVNSGTANFGANPTVVMTFKDGTFTTVPVVEVCTGGGTTDQPTVPWTVSATATQATFTWRGTPIGSKVYEFCYHIIG